MLRTSKFKFWNFIVGRMSQVYTLQQLHDEEVNFNNLRELQFIGLKDSHRVEIFEGDVLELPNENKEADWSNSSQPKYFIYQRYSPSSGWSLYAVDRWCTHTTVLGLAKLPNQKFN